MNEKEFKAACKANGFEGSCFFPNAWFIDTKNGKRLVEFNNTHLLFRNWDSAEAWTPGTLSDAIAYAFRLRLEAEGKQPESPTEPSVESAARILCEAFEVVRKVTKLSVTTPDELRAWANLIEHIAALEKLLGIESTEADA